MTLITSRKARRQRSLTNPKRQRGERSLRLLRRAGGFIPAGGSGRRGKPGGSLADHPCSAGRAKGSCAWLRWLALVLVAGYLLFAHLGCHGDEDNELFAVLRVFRQQSVGSGR